MSESLREKARSAAAVYDEHLDAIAALPVGHPARAVHTALGELAHATITAGCECVGFTIRTDYGTGVEHAVDRSSCPVHGRGAEIDAGPVYAEPVHACPPEGSGIMLCCGRTPFEVPRTDRMTSTERVTCTGVTPPEVGAS